MNRRDAFKAIVASAAALLGLKGLAARPEGYAAGTWTGSSVQPLGVFDVHPLAPVMGEQAHWPDADLQVRELYQNGMAVNARVTAVKINGEWVDTAGWSEEQLLPHLQPKAPKRRHV